ncbi:hypothetical protein INR49_017062, partial [Caranx melampygus]
MQISNREEDFIIDTLELRGEMYILNEAFTDPAIIRCLVLTLTRVAQRDFGLYVVNSLTRIRQPALNLARHSLDHLLKHFCSVDSDKRYQLADWRIRYVLPNHMMSKISEELPKEPQGIIACVTLYPLVRQQLLVTEGMFICLVAALQRLRLHSEEQGAHTHKEARGHMFGPDTSKVSVSDLPTFLLMVRTACQTRSAVLEDEHKSMLMTEIKWYHRTTENHTVRGAGNKERPRVPFCCSHESRRIIESFENPFRMISKRWKLQSIEQQQKELEAKRKAKEQAKEQAKKVAEERNKAKQSYQESPERCHCSPASSDTKSKDSTHFDPNRQGHDFKKKKNPKGQKPNFGAENRSMSYLLENLKGPRMRCGTPTLFVFTWALCGSMKRSRLLTAGRGHGRSR